MGQNVTSFTYRPDGLRATKSVGEDTTVYLYDGQSLIAEKEGSTLKVSYTNGLNEVISRTEHDGETADTVFFLYDANCNVNAIVDESGELVKTFDYDVFGALRTGYTPYGNNKLQFAGGVGHPTDDSGLIYMRARYYDPASGRFISEDPGRNGTNWYTYCLNNPVNMIDPNGQMAYTWLELFGLLCVIGAILGVALDAPMLVIIGLVVIGIVAMFAGAIEIAFENGLPLVLPPGGIGILMALHNVELDLACALAEDPDAYI